jgi:N utilization substance protein B
MKALYQRDVGRGAPATTLAYLCAEDGVETDVAEFAKRLLSGVLAHLPELDRIIAGKAKEWRLDRLANVDRNILRLGVYELAFGHEVPASVAINEAVELAKVYGGPESGRFINGVLGQVAREVAGAAVEGPAPDGGAG